MLKVNFISTSWLYHHQTFTTIRPLSSYLRLLSVSIPFHLHPPLSTITGFASVPAQKSYTLIPQYFFL
nr:MAG TPA: hypothetical protein [Caudoviricetes sp.]